MKVLIVDDEPIICESLCCDFKRMEHGIDYEVFTAHSVRAAEEIYYREEPELVITDINIPKVSGLALVETVHRHNPKVVILVLSAYDDFNYVRDAFTLGAKDYILKPIAFSELDERVRRLTGGGMQEKEEARQQDGKLLTVQELLAYVDSHAANHLSASELARRMAVNYGQFGRLFRETAGMSFTSYLLKTRMEKAKEYLKNPDIRIKQVAVKVGYGENPQHFSRDFTKYTGLSPKEYRAQILERG